MFTNYSICRKRKKSSKLTAPNLIKSKSKKQGEKLEIVNSFDARIFVLKMSERCFSTGDFVMYFGIYLMQT